MRFKLITDYKDIKKGKIFDSFNGLVSGVDDIRFDDSKYFTIVKPKHLIILKWFNDNFELIKRAIESQKYQYSSLQGRKRGWVTAEMDEVFQKIKKDKVYSIRTSDVDIWIKISKYFPTKFGTVFYKTENAKELFNQNFSK